MATSNIAIQLKSSGQTGNTPADLQHGEIAINYADGKIYYKDYVDTIRYINNQDTFATINSNGELILATTPTDILNLVAGNNLSISTDTVSKTITLDVSVDNSSGIYANAAFVQANSAFDEANSANVLAQGAYDAANTGINLAQSAYDYANTILGLDSNIDQYARDTANVAYETANAIANGTQTLANVTIATDGSLTFGDGKKQYFRAPIQITNLDISNGLSLGDLLPGDTYYDDQSGHLFVLYINDTVLDLFDVTPQA